MSENTNNSSEEVDLGKLFQLIGKGFSNLFKAIGGFFKAILHSVILALIFLKKNAIFIGIATVIGGGIGIFKKINSNPVYFSEMNVIANYNSAKVLYPKIGYLNNLIKIKDTAKLASLFNIKTKEASLLSEFKIEPLEKQKQLLNNFDFFKVTKDTIITKNLTFESYVSRISDLDLKNHVIMAYATDPIIISKLSKGIQKLVETDYLLSVHHKKNEELIIKEKMIKSDLMKLDTLRQRYNKVAILEASKQGSTSSLNLSSTPQSTQKHNFDMDVFKENNNLVSDLLSVNRAKVEFKDIISIVTNFSIGVQEKSLLSKPWFRYAVFGFILSILVLLVFEINKFLNNFYK